MHARDHGTLGPGRNGNQKPSCQHGTWGVNEESLAHPIIVTKITMPIAQNSGPYITTIGKDLWRTKIQNPARAICEPKWDAYVLVDTVTQLLTDSVCSLAQRCGESSGVRMIPPVSTVTCGSISTGRNVKRWKLSSLEAKDVVQGQNVRHGLAVSLCPI